MTRNNFLLLLLLSTAGNSSFPLPLRGNDKHSPDYARHVAPVFRKYCIGCHNAKDHEGKLNLQTFAGLMRGGENGKVLVPGDVAKSRLIGMLERKREPFMPPEGNKGPTPAEIALLKSWIKAGAAGPKGASADDLLIVPKIRPRGPVRHAIHSLAVWSPPETTRKTGLWWVALGKRGAVEIFDAHHRRRLRRLSGLFGDVTDLAVSPDGRLLAAASGEPGLYGEAVVWNTRDWRVIARLKGHHDCLYAVALSPDGKRLATGSYDRTIAIWDIARQQQEKQLTGHNGPVHDLAFHPRGRILASASGDRTVKIWDVQTGRRLDTLGQPEKDQFAVAFSPDGKLVAAGGADNRIRVWAITKGGEEGTNPLLYARFAHEAPILRMAFSADGRRLVSSSQDRTVKLWDTKEFHQLQTWKNQSDWVTGLSFSPQSRSLVLGRMDGTWSLTPLASRAESVALSRPIRLVPVPSWSPANLPAEVTVAEQEPNDSVRTAQRLVLPAVIRGVLNPAGGASQDVDLYRIAVKGGQTWILETEAARSKSPADTKIEVLHRDGRPVLRYLLRAVRDSYITFRPIDSSQTQVRLKNWEEMDLNQYLYMAGEVGRLFRRPQGPDSGYLFYATGGKRRCYFETTATVHAKDDPVYIVEAYPPDAQLVDNGLPVFPLYFVNDDDGDRKLGRDSRLTFTPPLDGEYLVRISDARGFGGKDFRYVLRIRPARPDFRVSFSGISAPIPAGSGKRLTVTVDRVDGFTGEVRVDVTGMPKGFAATSPIIVQADHLQSRGVITVQPWVTPTVWPMPAAKNARHAAEKQRRLRPVPAPRPVDWSRVKVTATASLHGRRIVKTLRPFGPLRVAPPPKVTVSLEPDPQAEPNRPDRLLTLPARKELVLAPGSTITAMLRIERRGYQGELKFDVDHLPHGVIVDNIGLNGILIRAGENRRRIYLTAAEWVPETTRLIHAVALSQGNPASRPILLRVQRPR